MAQQRSLGLAALLNDFQRLSENIRGRQTSELTLSESACVVSHALDSVAHRTPHRLATKLLGD